MVPLVFSATSDFLRDFFVYDDLTAFLHKILKYRIYKRQHERKSGEEDNIMK